MSEPEYIRNFCIIAHIDHGKSTLADRMLEVTGTIEARKMRSQFLDQMDLERERGITIKMQPVRMHYNNYILNLIDTPGHIDFNYEVSRALIAVEGAILLVDATQGVQAQTITNLELARKRGLTIIPVINKIDLREARVEETKKEIEELLECNPENIFLISAKTGEGISTVLDAIVKQVPSPSHSFFSRPPAGRAGLNPREAHSISSSPTTLAISDSQFEDSDADSKNERLGDEFQALIFDSHYSPHKGVIAHVRVFDGNFSPHKGTKLHLYHKKSDFEPIEVGIFTPSLQKSYSLGAGEIGYIATNIKDPDLVRVGDTIGWSSISGYQEPRPVVWASVYPEHPNEFEKMKDAFSKLKLNDAALSFEIEGSQLFGRSLRVGFLGMLHLEIIIERLSREFGIGAIVAQPSIEYSVVRRDGTEISVRDPDTFVAEKNLNEVREPWYMVSIVSRTTDIGPIMDLLQKNEGAVAETKTLGGARLLLTALVPLRKLVTNFFDDLKSVTQGYGSLGYEPGEMRVVDLEVLKVLVAEKEVPQFARLLPRWEIEYQARRTVEKLYELLPRQLFALKIQVTVGGRILASRTLPALAKNVTAKLYGGDRTRKMKLWKKQKEGKKRLTAHSDVQIPQEIYLKMIGK